jgi:hypothetical protein
MVHVDALTAQSRQLTSHGRQGLGPGPASCFRAASTACGESRDSPNSIGMPNTMRFGRSQQTAVVNQLIVGLKSRSSSKWRSWGGRPSTAVAPAQACVDLAACMQASPIRCSCS